MSGAAVVSGSRAAQLAKGALRRLAQAQQEPTPENYARAYAEEAGQPATVLPDRARAPLDRLLARSVEDSARREELLNAFMHGRWEQVSPALERLAPAPGGPAWAALIERLLRGLERGSRQWSMARKKESLQRVLDGSRSDAQRLQQRITSLLGAWESENTAAAEAAEPAVDAKADIAADIATEATAVNPPPLPAAATSAGAAADAAPLGPAAGAVIDAAHGPRGADSAVSAQGGPDGSPTTGPTNTATAWPATVGPWRAALAAGLPPGDLRAGELADALARLADQLVADGPTQATLVSLEQLCQTIQGLFAHRHRLLDQAGSLCIELGHSLADLAEDESWARGQAEALQARLADGLNARSVRAASEILAEARSSQARVRGERQAARDALKELLQRLLSEIGALDEQTGRFQDKVGEHLQTIERADSIDGLTGVVRELLDDSRAVQELVHDTHQRMMADHARASALEQQVRTLEGELRRLSDEVSTDALTQVANRRGLMQAFAAESARREAEDGAAPLAVGLIDIDNFKKLNDNLGHAAGDKALQALAAAVRDKLRPVDHLARFGGEEFVVLLPGTALAEAQQALTRLQRALSASLFMHDNKEVFVTFSAGVTAWRPGEALEAALERADEALYEAKRSGKNRTCTA